MNKAHFKSAPDYEAAKIRGIEKLHKGLTLSKAEDSAVNDKWYFTTVLPVETIREIVVAAGEAGVDPSFLVSAWIFKGMGK